MAASEEGNLAWDGCKGRNKSERRDYAVSYIRDFVTLARVISVLLNLRFCRDSCPVNIFRVSSFYPEPDNRYTLEHGGTDSEG